MNETPSRGDLEQIITDLLDRRADGASICPSDAARAIGGEEWRELMDPTRAAAADLEARGIVEITQHGERITPGARGPIRIRYPKDEAPPLPRDPGDGVGAAT